MKGVELEIFFEDNKEYFSYGEVSGEIYQAASGDWYHSIERYGEETLYYNCTTREEVIKHILSMI